MTVMLLAAAAGWADAPLTVREIVEQVVVPLALANDPKVGVNHTFSAEELAEIVRALNGNGIELAENEFIMQMVKSGHGLFEDYTVSAICEKAFGGPDGWTLEEQDWFNRQLVKMGLAESSRSTLPGPDNMTFEEAQAFAYGSLRKTYGEDLALEDRSMWRASCEFSPAGDEDPEDRWSFRFLPQEPEYGSYSVTFCDADPEGTAAAEADVPDWTQPYTGDQLMTWFRQAYSWSQSAWPQSAWGKLHEKMQKAELDPGEFSYEEYAGYRDTGYPEPGENDVPREDAVRAAKEALNKDRASLDSAVLTEYAGERSWLVTLVICPPLTGPADSESGTWVAAVDSATGAVRSLREAGWLEAYVPEAALAKIREGLPQNDTDYIAVAAEAVKARFPEVDPLDETLFTAFESGLYTHYVSFTPKSIEYGLITVAVSQDGEAGEIEADLGEPDGDNLFRRYRNVYGYYAEWDQERWIQLEKDMAGMKPLTVDGQALKATHYPEEASVKIGREEAKELAILASGERTASAHTCVLVDAQPHPVWILRVLTTDEDDPVFGIDAETGETVFREVYVVDETPDYVMYSLPETWEGLTGVGSAPTPTPLPDGRPWCWGMDFAPQEYWDRAGAFMDAHGIRAGHYSVLEGEWERAFGGYDFWPQEYQALNGLLQYTEEDLKDPDFEYLPFPDPEKKTQDEITEAARGAVAGLAEAEKGKDWAEKLKAGSTLYNDSRDPDAPGRNYGKHVWWVWFYEWTEENRDWTHMAAYAILDEDGNVLTAGLGEI